MKMAYKTRRLVLSGAYFHFSIDLIDRAILTIVATNRGLVAIALVANDQIAVGVAFEQLARLRSHAASLIEQTVVTKSYLTTTKLSYYHSPLLVHKIKTRVKYT